MEEVISMDNATCRFKSSSNGMGENSNTFSNARYSRNENPGISYTVWRRDKSTFELSISNMEEPV